jgi:hypothetical protein
VFEGGGLIATLPMVREDIKPAVEKKVKSVLNTQHVNPHHQSTKIRVKVKHGVKKLLNLNNIIK